LFNDVLLHVKLSRKYFEKQKRVRIISIKYKISIYLFSLCLRECVCVCMYSLFVNCRMTLFRVLRIHNLKSIRKI
jgi:hypothetical protein